MKKSLLLLLLTSILISSNFLLLSSDHNREYTKDICNRTVMGRRLFTDKEREKCFECRYSRLEVYDKDAAKYIASIAYDPFKCRIEFLSVDEEYRKKGIGLDLANKAREDMRTMHNCRGISLFVTPDSEKFWEKLGAEPGPGLSHVIPDSSSNLS